MMFVPGDNLDKPPVDAPHPSEAIPLDDPFWVDASYTVGKWVDLAARRETRRESSVLRWRSGEGSESDGAEALRKAFESLDTRNRESCLDLDSALATGSVPSPSLRYAKRQPSPTPSANYLGAAGGLVARLAQKREDGFGRAFRAPLPLFVSPRSALLTRGSLEDFRRYVADQRAYIADFGLGPDDLVPVLRAILAEEESGKSRETLESAAAQVEAMMTVRAGDPKEPRRTRDAFAAALWHSTRVAPKGGYLMIDDGRTITKLDYGQKCAYLRRLDLASRIVAAQYRWSVESGVLFLLCNSPQSFKMARIDYEVETDPGLLSRIVLTVDPVMAPEEVLKLYSHARRQVAGHLQSLSEAQLALVSHVFTQTHTPTSLDIEEPLPHERKEYKLGWKYLMESWNERQAWSPVLGRKGGQGLYSETWRFRHHADEAKRLLLAPKLTVPPKSPEYPPLSAFEVVRRTPGKSSLANAGDSAASEIDQADEPATD